MSEHILPVGSVVLLKNATKNLMIIGIKPKIINDSQKIYDYLGVFFPEGYLGDENNFLFDHSDISDVIFKGYENSEWKELVNLNKSEFTSKKTE